MDIVVEMLGRAVADEPFVVIGTQTVALEGDTLAVTPAMPGPADRKGAQELMVRVTAPELIHFAVGTYLDPATRPGPTPIQDGEDNVVGKTPAPVPGISRIYIAFAGAPRDAPYTGSILLGRIGVALRV